MDKEYLAQRMKELRSHFPILNRKIRKQPLVYFDNAASSQKPKEVLDAMTSFYSQSYANVHRGAHTLSMEASEEYEKVRKLVGGFVGCDSDAVVFTSGTTHSLNQVAFGLAHLLDEGDVIVLSEMEHHANIVPWQIVAQMKKAKIRYIPLKEYDLDYEAARDLIDEKVKIVSVCHVSNVLGTVNDIDKIATLARKVGAIMVVDGAQSVGHIELNLYEMDVDLFSFSAHKLCGPTGVGILCGKKNILDLMAPLMYGGDMIEEVHFEKSKFAPVPQRFEAGTLNIAGIIGFGAALNFMRDFWPDDLVYIERSLCAHMCEKLKEVKELTVLGHKEATGRANVFTFSIEHMHAHDIALLLDAKGIAVRSGHHCAMPLGLRLGCGNTARASLSFYNTFEEIDYFVKCLKEIIEKYRK